MGGGAGEGAGTATSPRANTWEWPSTRRVASVRVEPRSSLGKGSFRGLRPVVVEGALPAVHITRSAGSSCSEPRNPPARTQWQTALLPRFAFSRVRVDHNADGVQPWGQLMLGC